MKVLVYVPRLAAFGGLERHVCGLAATLAFDGHRVRLLTTSNTLGLELRAMLRASGVELREFPRARTGASEAGRAWWLLREVRASRPIRWDLIYTSGQSGLAAVPWLLRHPGTRIVHHHHGPADLREQASWSRLFRRLLQRAPEIVACSRGTRDALNLATGRRDVRFLPCLTCDLADGPLAERIYGERSVLHFGFVGRLLPEKGVALIRDLSRRPDLPELVWHVHGVGAQFPPEYFSGCPRLRYHGPFSGRAAYARVLGELDALVLLSRQDEGVPVSLIEGMSIGLPWLATSQSGTREIAVSPEDVWLLPAGATPRDIVHHLHAFVAHLRQQRTSRLRQRRAYDEHFAPPVALDAWRRFLHEPAVARERAPA